jgi:nicotinate-nucleotide pyrophosphorylase (carboxylating)
MMEAGPAMSFTSDEAAACERLVRLALEEDLGRGGVASGDLTSQAVIPEGGIGSAVFVVRPSGVIAGLPAAAVVFGIVDPALSMQQIVADGSAVAPKTRLAVVRGPLRSLLAAERTALNFLQRLSGIATLTARYVSLVAGLPCKVLDTRKTTPGWRLLEKYAVRQGGGHNHRMGLYDGILVKDNHLAGLQIADCRLQIAQAVARIRAQQGDAFPLEVEVDTLDQLDAALSAGPDVVLLDNMSPDMLREAVRRRNQVAPGVGLEASGGVNFNSLRAIAPFRDRAGHWTRLPLGCGLRHGTSRNVGVPWTAPWPASAHF